MKIQPVSLFFTLLSSTVLLTPACRTYGPAFSANTDPYMAKPAFRGEEVGAFYLSGRLNKGYEYYADEKNHSNEFSAHVSYMSKYFYCSGGFFGYWGKYNVNGVLSLIPGGRKQRFNGGGARIELGGRIPLEDKFDLLLGFNGELFREAGEFVKNSEDAYEDVFSFGSNRTHLNLAPVMDLRFVPEGKWDFGIRYSLDSYVSSADLMDNLGKNYLHRLTLHAAYGRLTAYGQIGFTPDAQQVLSLGMAYGIPFKKEMKEKKEDKM